LIKKEENNQNTTKNETLRTIFILDRKRQNVIHSFVLESITSD